MNQSASRSWFRFSLRSLLVVVTLVCIWLAWESSVVRTRKAARGATAANPAFQFTTAEEALGFVSPGPTPPQIARVSWIREQLGDKAIDTIAYFPQFPSYSDTERERLARLFPEAKVEQREILYEPCHPGCFPRGTLVLTQTGPRPIETMRVGEELTAMLASGEIITAQVQSIFVTDNRLWSIRTESGELITTETQPLCLAADKFRAAGELAPGDEILRYVDGEVHSTKVLQVSRTERIEQVINLVIGDCEAFVAGEGYLARSKPPAAALAR